jgi:ABC-type lipoprotein release transport system permease subunit
MEALQQGAWNNMISNVVNFYFGYGQIHQLNYWEERNIDLAFDYKPSFQSLESEIEEIQTMVPRLESFALASTGENTMGVLVVGMAPEPENEMTALKSRIVDGKYLEANDKAVIIASGVAERLDIHKGDTLLLISSGYHGTNAAGKYPVKGVVKFASPDLNKQMVYLPLAEAQWFYGADGLVTSIALNIDQQKDIEPALKQLKVALDTAAYEIMDWKEMMPDLLEAKALDSAGNVVVYFILYMIIGFGILGTILMMTKERSYEFGVLLAVGMKRRLLALTVWLEVVFLGMLGALAGVLFSMPVVYYFKLNPIQFSGEYAVTMEKFGFDPVFPAQFDLQIFFNQALIIFVLTAILALYPIWKIYRIRPIAAMRS